MVERCGEFQPQSVTPLDLVEYATLAPGETKVSRHSQPDFDYPAVFFAWLEETGQVKNNPTKGIGRRQRGTGTEVADQAGTDTTTKCSS
ncbi:MAG: hypothetical protein M0Z41_20780 [Peptococcaceae bacterium]|nr:hypothetical protein [Peptococcaceae bacterium]